MGARQCGRDGRPRRAEGFDASLALVVHNSAAVQSSTRMVARVMAGDRAALDKGLAAYAPDVRLWDRQRAWDPCDLMPGIAMTQLERWDDLGPVLARLELFAAGGGGLAGATASAIREEAAAARGGPQPTHAQLRALGFSGISQLLRFRPVPRAAVTA